MGINIGLVMSSAGIFYTPVSADLGVSKGDFGLYMTFVYAFSFLMLSVAGTPIISCKMAANHKHSGGGCTVSANVGV